MNWRLKVLALLFFFALCAAAAIGTHFARTRAPAPAPREFYTIVNHQLSDLQADDYDSAYRHSASGVQQKFSRAEFELMIQRDFSPMRKVQRVEFGAVHVEGSAALVQVFLITPDKRLQGYIYSFIAEEDGWKINGVQPLAPRPIRRVPGLHI